MNQFLEPQLPVLMLKTTASVYASGSGYETQDKPDDGDTMFDEPYKVVLYNDNYHTFDEVIEQIIKATRCSREKAERCTIEVHEKGRSIVYDGELSECLRVSAILEEINLKTEIETVG
jgi:ATP-dependent Clp protease adaptor protein ClpS